jgi:hypothetical protein
MPMSHAMHTFDGQRCRVLGREYTTEAPYVVVRFVDEVGNDLPEMKRVKPWKFEPRLSLYPNR